MAGSPNLKVYDSAGNYIAACKYAEDAAALAAFNGDGCKVKQGHSSIVLWHEGSEVQPAAESYDFAAQTIHERLK